MMKRFIRIALLLCAAIVLLSALSLKTVEAKATTSKGLQTRVSATTCQWSVVPSPSSGSLWGVAAVSASDIWAVGTVGSQLNTTQTVIEHWNGSSWSVAKSPTSVSGADLRAVAAVSASDIWAVGYQSISGSLVTLAERWNGTSWQVVKSSNVGKYPTFSAVAAVSAQNAWAVGSYGSSTAAFQTLTEQWNGNQWSVVKSPSPSSFSSQLLAVAATSATNVWAVGVANGSLIEHFHC